MAKRSSTRSARIQAKSASRREEQRARLRRAILDAAAELFLKHGYEGFSLRQVAERIGYSPTTIYLHFDNKDELLFEVAMEGFARFDETLRAAYHSELDPLGRIEALGRAYIAFGLARPVHYRLMFMQRGEFAVRPGRQDHRTVMESEGFGLLVAAVTEAIAAGAMKPGDPAAYANTLWSGVHGIVALAISMPFCDEVRVRQMMEVYFPMVRAGLASA